jgi:hypothetical protein
MTTQKRGKTGSPPPSEELMVWADDGGTQLPNNKNRHLETEKMSSQKSFTTEEAREIGKKLGITWDRFDVEQFRLGLEVELEHGLHDLATNVTNNDPVLTGKIALAHLNEFADYYSRLQKMEREAKDASG